MKKIGTALMTMLALTLSVGLAQAIISYGSDLIATVQVGEESKLCYISGKGASTCSGNGWWMKSSENVTLTYVTSCTSIDENTPNICPYLTYPKTITLQPYETKTIDIGVKVTDTSLAGKQVMGYLTITSCGPMPEGGFGAQICMAVRKTVNVSVAELPTPQPSPTPVYSPTPQPTPTTETLTTITPTPTPNPVITPTPQPAPTPKPTVKCVQTRVKACNSATGQVKMFPSTCLPNGWKICPGWFSWVK